MASQGCYPADALYTVSPTSPADTTARDPTQCGALCASRETQIRFSAASKVRSLREISLPPSGFTFESWVFSESDFIRERPQMVMTYGTTNASVRIALGTVFVVGRCDRSLRLPFGLPTKQWTHVAISFGSAGEITLYLNGRIRTVAVLQSSGCDLPASALLQLGRGGVCFACTVTALWLC